MRRFDVFATDPNDAGVVHIEWEYCESGYLVEADEAIAEIQKLRAENEALRAKLELLLDFAQTVGGSSSFWDEVWEQEPQA